MIYQEAGAISRLQVQSTGVQCNKFAFPKVEEVGCTPLPPKSIEFSKIPKEQRKTNRTLKSHKPSLLPCNQLNVLHISLVIFSTL